MRVKVLKVCFDKFDRSKQYRPGDVIEMDDAERIHAGVEAGFLEEIPEESEVKPETKPEPKKRKTTRKAEPEE